MLDKTPVERRSLAILRAYAKHLGIPRRRRSVDRTDVIEGEPLWNGRSLLWTSCADDEAHEIAHWLIATPEARRYVNYGWGFDYQYFPDDVTPKGLRFDTDNAVKLDGDDEVRASLLGFAMLVRTGINTHELYEAYSFVDWVRTGLEKYVPASRREVQPYVADFAAWLADQQVARITVPR